MTYTTYNPYTAAATAAFSALTCDRAKSYYSLRAQQDTQSAIDAAVTVGAAIYQLSAAVYALGAMVGAFHFEAVAANTAPQSTQSAPQKCLPAPVAIAALPAVSCAPRKPMVTPADVADIIDSLIDSLATPDHEQVELDADHANIVQATMASTKAQLVRQCKALGLPASGTKRQLAERLAR